MFYNDKKAKIRARAEALVDTIGTADAFKTAVTNVQWEIIKDADKLQCPMICEIINIPDPADMLETHVPNDEYALVRIRYPEGAKENNIIVDAWAKDVYVLKDADKEIPKEASKIARSVRNLYKNSKHNMYVKASWNSATGVLEFYNKEFNEKETNEIFEIIEKQCPNIKEFINENIHKIELFKAFTKTAKVDLENEVNSSEISVQTPKAE
jgi:hypothetical protein